MLNVFDRFIFVVWFIFRAYDRAAIKFRGVDADINFNVSDYDEDIKQVCENLLLLMLCWCCLKSDCKL